jgi:hypothetical protein
LEEVGKVESCPLVLRAQVFNGKDEGVVSKHGKPPKKPMESLKFFRKPFRYIEIQPGARCGQELTFSALLGARSNFLMVKKHTFPMKW